MNTIYQQKATILIVDDMPENLRLLSTMLRDHDYRVRAITSGAMALKSILSDMPDLVLLDVNMPTMNGYEVCKRLKLNSKTHHIPVIFISAIDEVVNKVEAFRVGGVDYITKPFHIEEVMARIDNQLMIQHTKEALRQSEERFRLFVENARDVIFRYRFVEPRGFEYISPSVEQVIGYAPAEYYADPNFDLKILHPDSLPRFGVLMQSPDSYREPIIIRYIRKDGKDVWIEQTHTILYDDTGKTIAIEAIARDITDRKRAAEALGKAYEELKILNDQLQEELCIAHRVQQSLLPPPRPGWMGLDMICHSVPAQNVGGDLYVYHTFDANHTQRTSHYADVSYVVVVGDVSGKGMPAALLMAITLGLVRHTITQHLAPGEFLSYLDDALQEYTQATHQNCTMAYVEIIYREYTFAQGYVHRETAKTVVEESSLHYALCGISPHRICMRVANAGSVPPIIKRTNGTLEWVDVVGLPLGVNIELSTDYQEREVVLDVGDLVILTSDGVIEAKNNTNMLFGFDGLEHAVRTAPCHDSNAMLAHIKKSLAQFVGNTEPHDDITIVVMMV